MPIFAAELSARCGADLRRNYLSWADDDSLLQPTILCES